MQEAVSPSTPALHCQASRRATGSLLTLHLLQAWHHVSSCKEVTSRPSEWLSKPHQAKLFLISSSYSLAKATDDHRPSMLTALATDTRDWFCKCSPSADDRRVGLCTRKEHGAFAEASLLP